MTQTASEPSDREERLDAVLTAYLKAVDGGQSPDRQEWLARHDDFAAELREFFAEQDRFARWAEPLRHLLQSDAPTPTAAGGVTPGSPDVDLAARPRFGDYELLAVIGQGGMGVVYQARQRSLNRLVALKMIRAGRLASAAEVQRFRQEAEAAAALDHANIVPIHEVGEHEGQLYFTMKLVQGDSLAGRREAFAGRPRDAARVLATVARAVHHAHERGILHRDLKPANILVDAAGSPHVCDFGLSRRSEGDGGLTETGQLLGTPAYMAPEQTAGSRPATTTASDVYSLGVILYELLAGRAPFRGSDVLQTLEQVRSAEPVPPRRLQPALPRDLETICLKCLHKDPAKRYASAAALADDLQRFLDGQPIQARPLGRLERLRRWVRRRPLLASLAAIVVLALAGAAVGIFWHTVQLRAALAEVREREQQVRQHLYVADLKLAHQFAWKNGDIRQMLERLRRHEPAAGEAEDRPGFEWHYLNRLAHTNDAPTLRGHEGEVYCVAFSPDGQTLATGGQDRTVKLWQCGSWQVRATLRGHGGSVRALAFSLDGRLLATASEDHTVKLWDPVGGTEQATLLGPADAVLTVAFSPDGKALVAGGRDQRLCHWDVATRKRVHPHRQSWAVVNALAFAPDGKEVVVASGAVFPGDHWGQVAFWQPEENVLHAPFLRDWGGLFSVACAHRGQAFAVGGADGSVTLVTLPQEPSHLHGHIGPVRSVAFSPNDTLLASGGDDTTVRVWDRSTRVMVNVGKGHTGKVWGVTFAPDGKLLASAGADGTVKLWDPTASQEHGTLHPAFQAAGPLAFSPDGKLLALVGRDWSVQLVDPQSWEARKCLRGHHDRICGLAFSPDGRRLVASAADLTVRTWDVRSGEQTVLAQGQDVLDWLAFSPDGNLLAGAGHSVVLEVWDLATGQKRAIAHGQSPPLKALTFSRDGKELASSDGQAVKRWDVATGQLRAAAACKTGWERVQVFSHDGRILAGTHGDRGLTLGDLAAPGQPVQVARLNDDAWLQCMAFSPDDKLLAVAEGERVHVIDVRQRAMIMSFRPPSGRPSVALAFGPHGKELAALDERGILRLWNLADFSGRMPPGQPLPSPVHTLAFMADGKTLLTGTSDEPCTFTRYPIVGRTWNYQAVFTSLPAPSIRFWDVASGKEHSARTVHLGVQLNELALSADGRVLATACSGGNFGLCDLATGQEKFPLFVRSEDQAYWKFCMAVHKLRWLGIGGVPKYKTSVTHVALSPDGRVLATACTAGLVQLWDTGSGRLLQKLPGEHPAVACLAFSPDGATLAVGQEREVQLWEVAGARLLRTLAGHKGAVRSVAFSADGKLLASGGEDWRIELWDPATGRERATLPGHLEAVTALAFAPDGRTLASGSWDRTVKLWHVGTAQEVLSLEGHSGKILCVAFAPDGLTLASGGENAVGGGEVYLWRAGPAP
jgi:WD40 repeat protein/tRNA A-37 threonylcarbamoyl transferase component Bud32